MESMDLIVIGAGWSGLAVAKTYSEVNPTAKVLVLEAAETIGGVWAQHRLYPGLKTNNMVGSLEYSDFPMDEATFGVKPGECIPGPVLHEYLRKYAEHFDVYRRIKFGVTVETVERVDVDGGSDGGDRAWKLTTASTTGATVGSTATQEILYTSKLVVATGLTSAPNLLSIPGSPSFSAPIFHPRDFLQNASLLKTATRVTVLGGAKSAWDVVYAFAAHGVQVDMIIRSSGNGPTWMSPGYVTPLKVGAEKLANSRFLTWFSPCVWGETVGLGGVMRRVLHGTRPGRWIVRQYWGMVDDKLMTLIGYNKHPEVAKLKPWTSQFLLGAAGVSALNYPTDAFEFVRNGTVKVHIADVTHLSPHTVHLDTGVELSTDALVCATGWKFKPPFKFLPETLESVLGLPSTVDEDPTLTLKVDAEILRQFPSLADPSLQNKLNPKVDTKNDLKTPATPYRLYRFIVPPTIMEERSIAFAGAMFTVSTSLIAQTQALWITAYFSTSPKNNLLLPSVEQAKHETLVHTEFCKLRYPQGFGGRFPDFTFDGVSYLDLLLRDLGLTDRRKTWWRDWWEVYGPSDYQGLVEEWTTKRLG